MGKNDDINPMLKSIVYVGERLGVPVLSFACCLWFLDRRAAAQDQVQQQGMTAIVNALDKLTVQNKAEYESLREAIKAAQSNMRGY